VAEAEGLGDVGDAVVVSRTSAPLGVRFTTAPDYVVHQQQHDQITIY